MRKFLLGLVGVLACGVLVANAAALSNYIPGFRTIDGSKLNLMVAVINNMTGFGTPQPITATTVSASGHVNTGATPPVLTSCGTGSPAITGSDTAGIVTMGTTATGCVITFATAYTGTPYCVVSWIATPLASQSYITSNTAITLTQTSTSGNKVQYVCAGPSGG